MAKKTAVTATPYRTGKERGGWYVENIATGEVVLTGMAQVGARQLADRLNARAA